MKQAAALKAKRKAAARKKAAARTKAHR